MLFRALATASYIMIKCATKFIFILILFRAGTSVLKYNDQVNLLLFLRKILLTEPSDEPSKIYSGFKFDETAELHSFI